MVEQRERKRLSKILHDCLQQYLVAAKLRMSELILGASDETLKQSAFEVENMLSESIKVSRSLAAELSPPILRDSGLLSGLEWLCRWMSEKYELKVQLVMDMDPPSLAEDVKVLLFESVRELLLNVVKHAGTKAAKIQLSDAGDNKLRISVSDNGRGLGSRDILTGYETGEGFGLFSIRERISLIGGNFEFESSHGNGAQFTLTAPYGVPEPMGTILRDNAGKVESTIVSMPMTSFTEGKIRILLTDDHAVMREGLARLLTQEPDFEVVGQANDGQQAVERAASLKPDVVLMDISMPVLDGIEATKIIHQQHPSAKIVGLSLYTEDERAKEMLDAGAALYVSKSGPPAELKAAIRACMNKKPEEAKGNAESQRMKS
jgi:CheY-like chemotaxis protein